MSIPFNFQMTKANNGKAVSRTGKQSKVNYKKVIAKKKKIDYLGFRAYLKSKR